MKYRIIYLFIIISLLYSCAHNESSPSLILSSDIPDSAISIDPIRNMTPEIRGAWIATVYNINFPSAPDLPEAKLREEIIYIVDTAKKAGLNTLFFQVHPSSDALYKSKLFPVSRFLFSDGNDLQTDVLQLFIEYCHESSIDLYAWINPLRVTTKAFETRVEAIASLDSTIGPGTTPDLLVFYNDGRLYYDPGRPEISDIISDCISEIINQYDVDGIVFDDYFYPYPSGEKEFDDQKTYEEYSNGLPLDKWRRENINGIIKNSYDTIKSLDPDCKFGVAPFGIWQNNNGTNNGSNTRGFEGYTSLFCDALEWASEGYIDFLSPQIYWASDEVNTSFDVLCEWWNKVLDGTGVDFIPSFAAYKYDDGWTDPNGIITFQTSLSRKKITYRGYVCYGFAQIINNSYGITDELKLLNKNQYIYYDRLKFPSDLEISYPITGTVFENEIIKLSGVSQIDSQVFINKSPVERSVGGRFETEIILTEGENLITIECGKAIKELILYLR